MRIAVIHHRLRGDAAADTDALVGAVSRACAEGTEGVVCPSVPSLAGLPESQRAHMLTRIKECAEETTVFVSFSGREDADTRVLDSSLGRTALVEGDACLRLDVLRDFLPECIETAVWRPGAESALQAEAVLEFALECAPALAGLLVIAECSGEAGQYRAEGISAIIHAGELVAEAGGGEDELLFAEIEGPMSAVEPDMPLPELPPILAQRLALREGRKLPVDYPADLS